MGLLGEDHSQRWHLRPLIFLKPGGQGENGWAGLEDEGGSGPVLGEAQSRGTDLA